MLTLIQHVAGRPWAIRGDVAAHVRGILAKEGIAGLRHLVELRDFAHKHDDASRKPRLVQGVEFEARAGSSPARGKATVAVIPVIGTLTQREEMIGSMDATRSTAAIAAEVQAAALEPSVDAIALEVDSGGGEVFGVPEAFTAIRESAKSKPVVAAVNSMAGSAAYYLASAASEIVITPSGLAGSIGVYLLHIDASKALEEMGEKWTFISAGKYKVEGNPAEALTEEARESLQGEVDRYYDMFVRDVAKGRGVSVESVRGGFGEGRMVGAKKAVDEKMADSVGTLQDAIRRAAQLGREKRDERAQAEAGQRERIAAAALLGNL